jgi:hypothetical protein
MSMRFWLAAVVMALSQAPALAGAGELRVGGGQVVALPGSDAMIALTDVVDQRCPSDANCYWEGLIRVELTVTTGDLSEVVVLCNMCDEATREGQVAGHSVTLMRLEPGRDVLDPLSRLVVLEDYTVVLAVAG